MRGANRTIALHDFGYAFQAGFNGKAFLFEKKNVRVSKIQSLNRFETKFEKQDSKNRNQRMTNYSSVNPLTYCWES